MSQLIVLETRRSKGFHKADLTNFSKEDIKKALEYYNSSSFVAVRNYRAKADDKEVIEIKFHRMSAKGQVKYSLKTVLTKEELKELGFVESPKKNLHKTQSGCTIDTAFDVEVKEPAKKISSKKAEKKNEAKANADSSKKTPLPHPDSKKAKVEDEEVEEDSEIEDESEEDDEDEE